MSCSLIPSVTLYGTTQITTTGFIWSTHTATITGSPYITLDGADLVTITPTSESLSSTQVPGQTVVTSVVPQQTLYYPCSQDTSQATSSAAVVDHAAQQAPSSSNDNGGIGMTAAAFSASAVSAQASAAAKIIVQTTSAAAAQQVPAGSSAAVGAAATGSTSAVSQAVVASVGVSTSLSSGAVAPQLVTSDRSSTSGITVAAVSSSHPSAASGNGTDTASARGTASHSQTGAIAGGVVGGVLALVMLCLGLGWVRRRMDRDKDEDWEARTLDSREDYWERRFRQLDAEVGGEGMESDGEKPGGAAPTGATRSELLEGKKIRLTLDLASDGLSIDRPPSRLSTVSTFFARSFPAPQVTPGSKPKPKSRKSFGPRPRSSSSSSQSHPHRQSVRSYFSSPLSRNGDGVSTATAPVPPLPISNPLPLPSADDREHRSVDTSPSLEYDDNDVSEELRDSEHADLQRISDFFSPTLGRLSLHTVFASGLSPPWARDLQVPQISQVDSLSDTGVTQGSEDEHGVAQVWIGGEWTRDSEGEGSRGRVGYDSTDETGSSEAPHVEETEDNDDSIGAIAMYNSRDVPTRSLTHPGTNTNTPAIPATHSDPISISRSASASSSSSDSFVASRRSRAYGRPGLFRNFKTYLSPIAASPTSTATPSRHASRTLSTLSAFSGFSAASRDRDGANQRGVYGAARTIYPVSSGSLSSSDTSQTPPLSTAPPTIPVPPPLPASSTQGQRERERERERDRERDRPDLKNEYDPSSKTRRDARRPPGLALSREATTPSLWLEEEMNPSRTGVTSVSANPTTAKASAFSPDTGTSAYGGLEEVGL